MCKVVASYLSHMEGGKHFTSCTYVTWVGDNN